jgi:hypothetical protein
MSRGPSIVGNSPSRPHLGIFEASFQSVVKWSYFYLYGGSWIFQSLRGELNGGDSPERAVGQQLLLESCKKQGIPDGPTDDTFGRGPAMTSKPVPAICLIAPDAL